MIGPIRPFGCWVGFNSTVHWWPINAKPGDACFCGAKKR